MLKLGAVINILAVQFLMCKKLCKMVRRSDHNNNMTRIILLKTLHVCFLF